MRYYYGMKYRGFSPGAQPKKGLIGGCNLNHEKSTGIIPVLFSLERR